jgi:hypothetical protein
MSYEAAQHVLTAAFNALATTPLLVAVIKMSLAVMFPAQVQPVAQAQAQAQAQDDTSWESIWATADEIGARYEDGGVYAPEPAAAPAAEPVAASEPAPACDYGAVVIDLVTESADMGLDAAPVQTPAEWSITFAEELMGRKKADLLAMAGTMGFSLSRKLNKAAIVAAIVAGQPC